MRGAVWALGLGVVIASAVGFAGLAGALLLGL